MPPSIILEVLRILKAEVDLRELTRAAEQQKEAQEPEAHEKKARDLAKTQDEIDKRTQTVIKKVKEIERKEKKNFAKDLARLYEAQRAMEDATSILSEPDTGARAIAAETEAIEALLKTKRGGGGGGGGGGSDPGGSNSGGSTDLAAISLIGDGFGDEAESRLVKQATGTSTSSNIPPEFRDVLDAYFSALEGDRE